MWKSVLLAVVLFISFLVPIAQPAWSSPLSEVRLSIAATTSSNSLLAQNSESPKAARTDASKPPAQPTEGKAVEPKTAKENSQAIASPSPTFHQPPTAYDMDAIKSFDDSLYGQ